MVKRVIIAVGGTGGHIFPALGLNRDLEKKHEAVETLFVGSGLASNPFFEPRRLPFREIRSGTLSREGIRNKLLACRLLVLGILDSFRVINDFKPDLIVGFGSYHSFPILLASKMTRTPYILHESNAFPGKVVRFFSKGAVLTAIQIPEASKHLKGTTKLVQPLLREGYSKHGLSKERALKYFNLDPNVFTILVFGGSQGARAINDWFISEINAQLKDVASNIQVIHLCGNPRVAKEIQKKYDFHGIVSAVKAFESKMEYAYRAADLAISRAGAASIFESVALEIPSILIPYPHAVDHHQDYNADFLVKVVKGGVKIHQTSLDSNVLSQALRNLLGEDKKQLREFESNLKQFNLKSKYKELSTLVGDSLGVTLR